MAKKSKVPKSISANIENYPSKVRILLGLVRRKIKEAAPNAEECISYGMPAFKFHGMVVWFAAHTNHIGFYPGAAAIVTFKKNLAKYKHAKGSVQFPFDVPVPLALIKRIVRFRVNANLAKQSKKRK